MSQHIVAPDTATDYPNPCPHCHGVWHSTATQWPFPLKMEHTLIHDKHCPFYTLVQDEEGDEVP